MVGGIVIRPAEERDVQAILALARLAAEAGDAFAWEATAPEEELAFYWLPNPQHCMETFVAEAASGQGIMGVCTLQPAAGVRGAHVAHGGFAVMPAAQGHGLGKRLCAEMVMQARQRGYTGFRFNTVVTTNMPAVRVCLATGFKVMCTLPKVFNHPQRGLLDAHVMFIDLEERPAPGPPAARGAAASQATAGEAASLRYQRTSSIAGGVTIGQGEEVYFEPRLGAARLLGSSETRFTVQPALPEGLTLDPHSGVVSGAIRSGPGGTTRHRVSLACTAELELQVQAVGARVPTFARRLSQEPEQVETNTGSVSPASTVEAAMAMAINEDFAAKLEDAVDAADIAKLEPTKAREYGNWMVWMVHRAFIDDESLLELDFTSMHMPPGHIEKRIAPKLMQALATNTHLEVVSLSNANVERSEGLLLAASLRQNTTLLELNLESNMLDSSTVREIAEAVQANPRCALEHFRISHQKQMGQFYGRPTEKAVGEMMQTNETIVKLGFECDDAHWRNLIDRALLRNNDFWRKRQQQAPEVEELPAAEEKTLGHLTLEVPSEKALPEKLFPPNSMPHLTFREYVIQTWKFPTTTQLQNCARNSGMPMTYTVAAPLIKECRASLLNHALDSEVVVRDAFGTDSRGTLRNWKENNEQWTLEVDANDGSGDRYLFRSRKEPGFSIGQPWATWLAEGGRRASVGRAGA